MNLKKIQNIGYEENGCKPMLWGGLGTWRTLGNIWTDKCKWKF